MFNACPVAVTTGTLAFLALVAATFCQFGCVGWIELRLKPDSHCDRTLQIRHRRHWFSV